MTADPLLDEFRSLVSVCMPDANCAKRAKRAGRRAETETIGTIGSRHAQINAAASEGGQGGSAPDPFHPPLTASPPAWRRWFALLLRHKTELGHASELAHLLAYGEALNVWHRALGTSPPEGLCAGCGEALRGHEAYSLHDRARLHGDACLARYGERWRSAAADALAQIGFARPEGWKP